MPNGIKKVCDRMDTAKDLKLLINQKLKNGPAEYEINY